MKKFVLSLLFVFATLTIISSPITPEQSRLAAENFYKALTASSSNSQWAYTATNGTRGEACFHVYNIDHGFVIVSADDRVKPILGYSTEGNFDAENLPFGLQDLLRSYTDEISAIMQNVTESSSELQAEWATLVDGTYVPTRNGRSVNALLDNNGINNWQQNNGYNYYCPTDANGPGGHCYVGCCALSMGQVMHYWQHPAKGTGSHSYDCNHAAYLDGVYGDYGTLSANFGSTTYDFANMPNNLNGSTPSSQILKIARLLNHCGIAIDMWYGNQGSMAFHDDIGEALETYFKYDETFTVWKDSYNGDWEDLLKSDLDLGRPLIYCAYASAGGHEFVCDGYNDDNYFHFNMGWGGSYNGYYAISNLNAQYNFNSSHGAIAHIRPLEETPDALQENDLEVTVYPNPVSDRLYIAGEGIHTVQLFDVTGKQITRLDCTGGESHEIGMGQCAPGTYFVRIEKEGMTATQKIIKKVRESNNSFRLREGKDIGNNILVLFIFSF